MTRETEKEVQHPFPLGGKLRPVVTERHEGTTDLNPVHFLARLSHSPLYPSPTDSLTMHVYFWVIMFTSGTTVFLHTMSDIIKKKISRHTHLKTKDLVTEEMTRMLRLSDKEGS